MRLWLIQICVIVPNDVWMVDGARMPTAYKNKHSLTRDKWQIYRSVLDLPNLMGYFPVSKAVRAGVQIASL